MTLPEILFAVAAVALVMAVAFPSLLRAKRQSSRIRCISHMKQIGTAFRLYANDYDGRYPFQVLTGTNPPTLTQGLPPFDTNDASNVWMVYWEAHNELGSPRILVCPTDPARRWAKDFETNFTAHSGSFAHPNHRMQALSYFFGLTATESDPDQLVAGDRNFVSGGTDLEPNGPHLTGQVDLMPLVSNPRQPRLRWGSDLHRHGGNIVLSDGSAQQLTSGKLRDAVANTRSTNSVVWLPNLPATLPPPR